MPVSDEQQQERQQIVLHLHTHEIHVHKEALAQVCWAILPPFLTDPGSPQAQEFSVVRIGIKGVIRPFLPRFLAKLFIEAGEPVPEVPRAKEGDQLAWLMKLLLRFIIRQAGKREWRIEVIGAIDSSSNTWVYQVCGLSPVAEGGASDPQTPPIRGPLALPAGRS